MEVEIQFDKPMYSPDEPITIDVLVSGTDTEPLTVTFTGTVTIVENSPTEWQASTQVAPTIAYGSVTGPPGYTVQQDPTRPSRYTAVPTTEEGGDGPTAVAG